MKGLKINKAAVKKAAPELAGAALGGITAGAVTKLVTKIIPAQYQNENVINGIPLVLGLVLGIQKEPMLAGAGKGMIAVGAQKFSAKFGLGDPYLGEVPQYIEIEGLDDGTQSPVLGSPGGELTY